MFERIKGIVNRNETKTEKSNSHDFLVQIDCIFNKRVYGEQFKQVRYMCDSGSYSVLTQFDLGGLKVGDKIMKSELDKYCLSYDEVARLQTASLSGNTQAVRGISAF